MAQRRKGEAALDGWSWVHLGSGVVLGLTGVGLVWGVLLLVAYEGFEAALRRIKVEEGGLFEYESWPNIIADILIGAAGFLAGFSARGFLTTL